MLARFTFRGLLRTDRLGQPLRSRFLTPLGLVAGFMDATGGGGWGPVGTPALLASGRMEPRRVVGSIDTSELLVSVAASLGFLVGLGTAGIDVTWVVALLLGGLVAAPVAAWLVRLVPPRVLGSAVGGIIVLTNVRTLLQADLLAVATPVRTAVHALVAVVWVAAVAYSVREHRRTLAQTAPPAPGVVYVADGGTPVPQQKAREDNW